MSVNEVSNEAQRPYFGKGDLVSRTVCFSIGSSLRVANKKDHRLMVFLLAPPAGLEPATT